MSHERGGVDVVGGQGMNQRLHFVVLGEPVAKGRPRFRARGKSVQTYTPAQTREYEQRVAQAADVAAAELGYEYPMDADYHLTVMVYRTHRRKGGDLDNYVKAVSDALNGIAWRDDSQVVSVMATLEQAVPGQQRVVVTVGWVPAVVTKAKARRAA